MIRLFSNYNALISHARRANLDGYYDIHTNVLQYPKIMQPTHARWERLPPPDPRVAAKLTKGLSTLSLTNDSEETAPPVEDSATQNETHESNENDKNGEGNQEEASKESIFSTIPAALSRRFAIHDVYYEAPPHSNLGIPGPDGDVHDLGSNGFVSVANPSNPEFMSPEILEELPAECKEALIESAARECEWKSKWCSEVTDGARRAPLKSYAWFP